MLLHKFKKARALALLWLLVWPSLSLSASETSLSFSLPPFEVHWDPSVDQMTIFHKGNPQHTIWSSTPGGDFIQAGWSDLSIKERRGSFQPKSTKRIFCNKSVLNEFKLRSQTLKVSGEVTSCRIHIAGRDRRVVSPRVYPFTLVFDVMGSHLRFRLTFDSQDINYIELSSATDKGERFFGFGQQFSHVNLKGHVVPILSQEGGIGRGHRLITPLVNFLSPGSGGSPYTTYAPAAHFITDAPRSMFLENTEYMEFDLTEATRYTIKLHHHDMTGRVLFGASILELVERYTEYAGRMTPLPDWIHQGAMVGMQGGTQRVLKVYNRLQELKTPLSSFWLQDWVGERTTAIGKQLWWNWELDRGRYPGWHDLRHLLAEDGVRILGYTNPFLVDVAKGGKPKFQRNMFQEAARQGFLVTKKNGQVYPIDVTDFSAALLDLSNPEARKWMKDIIKEEMLGQGLDGWMADFGEALPFDAVLHQGDPKTYHNQYPVEWAKLNREAIQEAGKEGEVLYFSRSGFTKSPGEASLFWQGDQMVTWDGHDGFVSAIKGLLSGGFSGFAINHSDIGGYTGYKVGRFGYAREKELLMRWGEMAAFTAVYRTHEGNAPDDNVQFYSDEETYRHFAEFAKVYKALGFYRRQLFQEAYQKGHPVVRHPIMVVPKDDVMAELKDWQIAFFLGDEFLVAPVVRKKTDQRKVYLPKGRWVHLWSSKIFGHADGGRWVTVHAPIGEPPVFFRVGSMVGQRFLQELSLLK